MGGACFLQLESTFVNDHWVDWECRAREIQGAVGECVMENGAGVAMWSEGVEVCVAALIDSTRDWIEVEWSLLQLMM